MDVAARWDEEHPWTRREAVGFGLLLALGLVGLGVCWFGLTGEAAYQDQVPWLVGAILCVLVAGTSIAGWLMVGVRSVHAGSAEVAHVVRSQTVGRRRSAALPRRAVDSGLVTAPTMTKVHRPGCLLVRGKQVVAVSEGEADRSGLIRCGACCR